MKATREHAVSQAAFRGRRVLIIDRHPAVRASLRELVATLGMTSIHMAESSQSAKRHVSGQQFDVILCDYLLEAHKDGQQLLEELRHMHAIPLTTIFMIVTGERAYQSVVSVAELAPDDYLIKPFTPEHLAQRLHKALEKKHVFRIAHELVEAGKPREAIVECDQIAHSYSRFLLDALRLKAELLVALDEKEQAEELYRRIVEHKAVPWARMGLAWVLYEQGELDEAEKAAAAVIAEKPEYMSAYSFLAEVQEAKGQVETAMETLDKATVHSPNNVKRLRKLGELAVGAQDLDRARRAFDRVLERAADSDILQPDDFANVVRVAIEQGAIGDTDTYVQQLRRRFRGRQEGVFVADLLDSLCLAKRGQHAAARASLLKALDAREQLGDAVSPQLMMDLAESCVLHDMQDSALGMLGKMKSAGVALRKNLGDLLERHSRRAEFDAESPATQPLPATDLPGATELPTPPILPEAATAVPGQEHAEGPPRQVADQLDMSALPKEIRRAVIASNAAENDFELSSKAAAALLELFRQGKAGSDNDVICMRTLLRRMFLARSRHPHTVQYHKEFGEIQGQLTVTL